jgi:hypothetical protein
LWSPEVREDGTPTGFYLVTAGEGRQLAQLLRAKRKQIKKTHPIRCYPACAQGAVPLPSLFGFLPRAAILGTTVLLILLAWSRHLAERAVALDAELAPAPDGSRPTIAGEWLVLPEAPLLHLRAEEVVLIRSAGNYSEIVTDRQVHLVRATLTVLAGRFAALGSCGFTARPSSTHAMCAKSAVCLTAVPRSAYMATYGFRLGGAISMRARSCLP